MSGRKYSNTKIFHFSEQLKAISSGNGSTLVHVRLKPTNRCNHHCEYCCYRSEHLFLSERMKIADEIPPAKMRELIADLANMGVKAVTLSGGGEPLCYPHISETVQGLLDRRIKVAMLTNGSLLRGEIAKLMAKRATWVRISMDAADGESYGRMRHVGAGEFDVVCRNIREFASIAERKCQLGINLIVTRQCSGQVRGFLAMAKDLGSDHVKVSGAVVSTDAAENARYLAPFHDVVKQQIADATAELADESFEIVDKFYLPDSEQEGFERDYTWCPFIRFLTVIAADQNVYTCHDKAYTTSGLLGSIRDCSFAKLWQSEALQERLRGLDPSVQCRHHCVAHGKNLMLLDYLEADGEHLEFV